MRAYFQEVDYSVKLEYKPLLPVSEWFCQGDVMVMVMVMIPDCILQWYVC